VSGEPVRREDVVIWYATHLELAPESGNPIAGPAGPDLVPGHWVRVASADIFGHVSSEDSYRP